MEFLKDNYLDTTTALTLDSNTLTGSNLFDYKPRIQWVSLGYGDDNTTTSIVISFDSTKTVSRIALCETNVKAFDIFYNGATANTFSLTTTSSTITSQWSNNSETSLFLYTTPVNCTSVTFDLKSTQVANSEKAIGTIYVGQEEYTFERVPSSKNYIPKLTPKEVIHKMSDGSIRRHWIDENWSVTIKYKNITESFRNSLKDVYDQNEDFVFCPFGTSTSWDGILFNSVWSGSFDFYKYSDNAVASGYSGSINLKGSS